jgi:TPR repeat protein
MFGMRVSKQCDWNKAERLLLEAKQTPEVIGLQGLLARERAGRRNKVVVAGPLLLAEALRLWETAAKLGDWWSRFWLLAQAFQGAPESTKEEAKAEKAMDAFIGVTTTSSVSTCKLNRPDCALSMHWLARLFDDDAKVAARLGFAWQVSHDEMNHLCFPSWLGRDPTAVEVEQNWELVRARLDLAADAGLAEAYSRLGYYLDEHGEESKAQELYERGARAGCRICIANLAQNAYDGQSVPKDRARAFALWSQAADLGDAESMLECGDMAWRGDVAVDLPLAKKFFERAVAAGMSKARTRLNRLLRDMELQRRAELEAKAAESS